LRGVFSRGVGLHESDLEEVTISRAGLNKGQRTGSEINELVESNESEIVSDGSENRGKEDIGRDIA